ncbi:hypothetical protein [Dactylosporangium sp. CA-092794]|uniref:hypothetical protein n=1 Tax=Dactylosporangium sp. CA-092794 TaxID=3239929 RepID=UPI003D9073D9
MEHGYLPPEVVRAQALVAAAREACAVAEAAAREAAELLAARRAARAGSRA